MAMPKSTSKDTPYDFITRNYRDPGGDDPVKRWLPHPENARAICGTLFLNGIPEQDLEDGLQDVFVRALMAFAKPGTRVPADLREMKAFCAAIAKKHAMATLRKESRRERLGHAGICEQDADEYTALEYGAPAPLDPVDAGRQLAAAAQLFRDGHMPDDGLEILECLAEGCTHEEIAQKLQISTDTVRGRIRMMRARVLRRGA